MNIKTIADLEATIRLIRKLGVKNFKLGSLEVSFDDRFLSIPKKPLSPESQEKAKEKAENPIDAEMQALMWSVRDDGVETSTMSRET